MKLRNFSNLVIILLLITSCNPAIFTYTVNLSEAINHLKIETLELTYTTIDGKSQTTEITDLSNQEVKFTVASFETGILTLKGKTVDNQTVISTTKISTTQGKITPEKWFFYEEFLENGHLAKTAYPLEKEILIDFGELQTLTLTIPANDNNSYIIDGEIIIIENISSNEKAIAEIRDYETRKSISHVKKSEKLGFVNKKMFIINKTESEMRLTIRKKISNDRKKIFFSPESYFSQESMEVFLEKNNGSTYLYKLNREDAIFEVIYKFEFVPYSSLHTTGSNYFYFTDRYKNSTGQLNIETKEITKIASRAVNLEKSSSAGEFLLYSKEKNNIIETIIYNSRTKESTIVNGTTAIFSSNNKLYELIHKDSKLTIYETDNFKNRTRTYQGNTDNKLYYFFDAYENTIIFSSGSILRLTEEGSIIEKKFFLTAKYIIDNIFFYDNWKKKELYSYNLTTFEESIIEEEKQGQFLIFKNSKGDFFEVRRNLNSLEIYEVNPLW
ncbi:MAG: hypothetical protein JXR63_03805 [Spirochaetales bacterium]|nr:hypothetical protein [Spirochaetales bacterium]